jgi:undecaprenyl-diphosphatase
MFDFIIYLDKQLFLLLNSAHCSVIDPVMVFVSGHYTWLPLYAGILLYLFWRNSWKLALLALTVILLTFACTDMVGHAIKLAVGRPRPCFELDGVVHLLEKCSGKNSSFISNHSANVFGLATVTSLLIANKYYKIFIYSWAILIAYSRIYVGKHYPLDAMCGAAFGMLTGYLFYFISRIIFLKFKSLSTGFHFSYFFVRHKHQTK